MIRDAFDSEFTKAIRNRTGLFWGFLFTPLVSFLYVMGVTIYSRTHIPVGTIVPAAPMGAAITAGLGAPGNPLYGLFWIIGAATLFAGEYRWSTYRYMLVRNSRLNILGAKFAVFALLVIVSLALFVIGNMIAGVVDAAMGHATSAVTGPSFQGVLTSAGIVLAADMLRMLGVGALVALAATVTRSMIGALIIVLVLLVAEAAGGAMAQGFGGPAWLLASLPGMAFHNAQTFASLQMGDLAPPGGVNEGAAFACLLAWVVVPAAAAAALFQRQDLSRE